MFSTRKTALAAASFLIAGLGFAVAPQPAQAIGETCVVLAQPANVSSPSSPGGGLYYPATDPAIGSNALSGGPHFTWNLDGKCADGQDFTSSGTGQGWCGRSVGHGTGRVAGRSYTIYWESTGSQLVLLDQSAFGSVNAQANPPGSPNGSCLSGTAKTFLVDGSITNLT